MRLTIRTAGPARVEVRDQSGEMHQPAGALMDRTAQDVTGVPPDYRGHFVSTGTASLDLSPGRYTVAVEKGPEFERLEESIDLPVTQEIRLVPRRWIDMAARDWWCADFHLHRPVADADPLLRAENLNLGIFITMWNYQGSMREFDPVADRDTIEVDATHIATVRNAEDERGGGAWMLHDLDKPVDLSDRSWWYPQGADLVTEAQDRGAWFDCEKLLWWEVPVMMTATRVDSVGVLNNHYLQYGMFDTESWGRPRDRTEFSGIRGYTDYDLGLYYRYLNCGFRLPASAGSASGVLPAPPGYSRVYVHDPGPFSVGGFYAALRAGRSFVTNGPMLFLDADGAVPGSVLDVRGNRPVRITARGSARWPVVRTELVGNGRIIADSNNGLLECEIPVAGLTWLAARCWLESTTTVQLAHTSPIYLTGPAQTWDSTPDRMYFVGWLDELIARSTADRGRFAAAEQRESVIAAYQAARERYAANTLGR